MVAYLQKLEGSEAFHQIVDFLNASHIKTTDDGEVEIIASIDGQVKTITEASLRRHLKLEDSNCITSLPNTEIFEQLALMRVDFPLFPTMITAPKSSPSRITSLPSLSPQIQQSSPLRDITRQAAEIPQSQFPTQTQVADEATFTSVDVDAGGAATTDIGLDAVSNQNEMINLVTKLIDRVKVLENDLKQTKKDEDAEEDSSKQRRKIFDIDKDPTILLVQPEQDMEYDFDVSTAEGFTTASIPVTTASAFMSTTSATPEVSTVAANLVYIRRSLKKRKDKGKAIMKEDESIQKKSKKQLEQERLGHEEAIRLQEQINEEENQRIARDAKIAKYDPAVLIYHALQNRSFSVAEVRKNMCMYLKNQGGNKLSHFKEMSYEDIRPIFERLDECLAMANLGAIINLMPLSVWKKFSLPELTSTRMTHRNFAKPNVLIRKNGTSFALIDVYGEELTLRVDDEAITFKVGQTSRYSYNDAKSVNRINVIDVSCEEHAQEVLGFSDSSTSGNPTPSLDPILSTFLPSLTPFEGGDFILEEIEACLTNDSIPPGIDNADFDPEGDLLLLEKLLNDDPSSPLPPKELHFEEIKTIKPSIEEPPELELKDLPSHLEYAFLEGTDKLPVIISKELKEEEKAALLKVLKSHKRAIAWKISDIKGINPSFCTHKILLEDSFKPAVQHQRRVNLKIHEVIKKEVIKLLDAGLIYPISDSPWVSPVHCVPKKGGMIVVANEDNELIPTRLVTGWRICIDYRKLNDATRKDHFPLPFMDQMLERLAGNEYYFFLDGFSRYFQIPIDPLDQEKTTFTCPNGTFSYRRMPFGLCNATGTLQRCMMAIFYDMIEETMEVFMDEFSVFGDSFSSYLSHLDKMLKRCEDTNLVLNWEKCHFMVKEGIVLGHKIYPV
ncbi:reverse transcriptase domain-containing protein [Tanacetum coccineum]